MLKVFSSLAECQHEYRSRRLTKQQLLSKAQGAVLFRLLFVDIVTLTESTRRSARHSAGRLESRPSSKSGMFRANSTIPTDQ